MPYKTPEDRITPVYHPQGAAKKMPMMEKKAKMMPNKRVLPKAKKASPMSKMMAGAKKAVVGAASDMMAAPARMKAGMVAKQATKDVAALKLARKFPKEAANFDMKGKPTQALKARTMADEVRMRVGKKK